MVFMVVGWAALLTMAAVCVGLAVAVRNLWSRLQALERRLVEATTPSLPVRGAHGHEPSPLHGLRVEVSVRQDHPLSPFEALLREALTKEAALIVDVGGEVRIAGTLKGNGYADVYFDADLTLEAQGETLFKVRERPPHGDRPENLAREAIARLKTEIEKRERRGALRELGL